MKISIYLGLLLFASLSECSRGQKRVVESGDNGALLICQQQGFPLYDPDTNRCLPTEDSCEEQDLDIDDTGTKCVDPTSEEAASCDDDDGCPEEPTEPEETQTEVSQVSSRTTYVQTPNNICEKETGKISFHNSPNPDLIPAKYKGQCNMGPGTPLAACLKYCAGCECYVVHGCIPSSEKLLAYRQQCFPKNTTEEEAEKAIQNYGAGG